MTFPELPDDDRDFTPELARKIIAKYQEIILAQKETIEALRSLIPS